jgi:hypothetical protein
MKAMLLAVSTVILFGATAVFAADKVSQRQVE